MPRATEPVSIDGITFDALIDSEENWEADVPAFPVETGFEVSDTIILRAKTLSMTLYLTNTPVTWLQLHGSGPHRIQEVIDRLRDVYFAKEPISVTTSDADYENMAITSIGLPKSIEVGAAREIPITFRQIRTVEAATTSVPASLGRGGDTGTNAGTANTNARPNPAASAGGGNAAQAGGDGSRGSVLYNLSSSAGLLGGGNRAIPNPFGGG